MVYFHFSLHLRVEIQVIDAGSGRTTDDECAAFHLIDHLRDGICESIYPSRSREGSPGCSLRSR